MKRFAESDRFDDRWYSRLLTDAKIIFEFLCASCDHGGIWDCNFELATFKIGFHRCTPPRIIDWDLMLEELNSGKRSPAVIRLPGGEKWWVTGFVAFQYGPAKLRKIPPHIPIFRALIRAGVWQQFTEFYPDMVPKEFLDEPPITIEVSSLPGMQPSIEDVKSWPESKGLPIQEVVHFHSYWSSRGWKRGRERIHDPKAALTDWKLNWIKAEDKKLSPSDLTAKVAAVDKEIARLGQKTRMKAGSSILEPDPKAMNEIRELRVLRRRYELQLHGWTQSHQPTAESEGKAEQPAEDPPDAGERTS